MKKHKFRISSVLAFINNLKLLQNCLQRSFFLKTLLYRLNIFKAVFREFAEIYYRKPTETVACQKYTTQHFGQC